MPSASQRSVWTCFESQEGLKASPLISRAPTPALQAFLCDGVSIPQDVTPPGVFFQKFSHMHIARVQKVSSVARHTHLWPAGHRAFCLILAPSSLCPPPSASHLNPSLVVKSSAVCLPSSSSRKSGNTVFYIRGRCNGSTERDGVAVTTTPFSPLTPWSVVCPTLHRHRDIHPMVSLSTFPLGSAPGTKRSQDTWMRRWTHVSSELIMQLRTPTSAGMANDSAEEPRGSYFSSWASGLDSDVTATCVYV